MKQPDFFTKKTETAPEITKLSNAELWWWPEWRRERADQWLAELRDELAWEQHVITLFGKKVACPRLSAWHGDPEARYTYSQLTLEPRPWTPTLCAIRQALEECAQQRFNSALGNWYRHGQDSMGWHSDDEPELGPEPVIASLSLGATRRFQLRHRFHKDEPRLEFALSHGSLLIMRGATQQHWQHQVPKTKRPVGERLNLTFRLIFPNI